MKLLVITQTVDKKDKTLGFFHGWLLEMAKRCDKIVVICLSKGEYDLPKNISVYSLGKEDGVSKMKYLARFFSYIWKYHKEYDLVFVHMNQEYILLGGLIWKSLGKKIFFWRNHRYGNFLTGLAVWFSDTVFATSESSYTARFKKTKIMPAGIDTDMFKKTGVTTKPCSFLMLGRIAKIKNIETGINLISNLVDKGLQPRLSIVGDVLPKDKRYFENLKSLVSEKKLRSQVFLSPGVSFENTPRVYQGYQIFLNFTDTGSFDKTVIEALACGLLVLITNQSFKKILPPSSCVSNNKEDILKGALNLLSFDQDQYLEYGNLAEKAVLSQSLKTLMDNLFLCINQKK